ncbi:MAG: WG repeat-containing protein [Psychrobacter sp.]|nr:WG repeat-containing protein [Psychrobacter sp.]
MKLFDTTKTAKNKKSLPRFVLNPLMAAIVMVSALATSTTAIADNCSCNNSSVSTVSIEESNEAHPNQLSLAADNAYYQLKDQNGRILQDRLYEVNPFPDGRMIAKRDGKYGLIGTQGELIFAFNYDGIEVLPADLYLLSKQQGAGYSSALVRGATDWLYPASGKFVDKVAIEQLYYDETNSIGYYKTTENGKVGLINDQKQTLISNRYDELELLDTCPDERLFMTVTLGDKTGLVDQYQKFVVPLEKNQAIENFNEDEQIFKVSKIFTHAYYVGDSTIVSEKLVKGKGQTLIESDTPIKTLADNLYQYSSNNKYGIINSEAEVIAPVVFDYISSDSYSALIVTKDNKQGILQTQEGTKQLIVNTYYDQLQEAYMDDETLAQLRMSDSEEAYAEEDSDSASDAEDDYEVAYAEDEVSIDTDYTENNDYDFQDTLFIARNNNKFGLIDSADRVRIPFLYDDIKLSTDTLLVKKDQKYGLLTSHNETVAGVFYDDIELMYNAEEDLVYRVTEGDQQGIIDVKGEKLFPLSPYQITDISDSVVNKNVIKGANGKYGLLSENSRSILLPAEYEVIEQELSNGYIIAQLNGKKVLIDTYGQVMTVDLSQYTEISELDVTDNLLVTNNSGKQGVITVEGKTVIMPKYDAIDAIRMAYYSEVDSAHYYMIEVDERYGLLDDKGKVILKPEYSSLNPLGYLPYVVATSYDSGTEDIKQGLINANGKVIKAVKYDYIYESYYDEDQQIVLITVANDIVEIYDKNLKLIKTMSVEEYEQSS